MINSLHHCFVCNEILYLIFIFFRDCNTYPFLFQIQDTPKDKTPFAFATHRYSPPSIPKACGATSSCRCIIFIDVLYMCSSAELVSNSFEVTCYRAGYPQLFPDFVHSPFFFFTTGPAIDWICYLIPHLMCILWFDYFVVSFNKLTRHESEVFDKFRFCCCCNYPSYDLLPSKPMIYGW